ncbi:MAG: GatB/YqeY domain-containing protein [Myxococcota bacterium]|nr:GatB/YqeY domain-containing protein [Myxococcota bacterium]MEC8423265.1 GatB/YqeY domain-containing protein [Myxococcota bacterium]
MAIIDDVTNQMKAAMRAREADRLRALRGIRAAFIEEMKKDGRDTLPDDAAIATLRRLGKQRRDSLETYEGAGRQDLADAEAAELQVIETFLPQLADEEQTQAWVDEAVASTGASSMRDMGRVMGALMKAHRGDVDGGLAKKLVQRALQG